ncbi:uncharacterized protein LOC123516750 [Portunus trituberculatus]|uniref:uncharacterized protein LOC123516750 n=1 Tax=Portunus trituberculatus TaxID=210409 RepID=UPI001E1D18C3|nr:uncharacterized protein LOC123516750 [Portunus trituberculatus]
MPWDEEHKPHFKSAAIQSEFHSLGRKSLLLLSIVEVVPWSMKTPPSLLVPGSTPCDLQVLLELLLSQLFNRLPPYPRQQQKWRRGNLLVVCVTLFISSPLPLRTAG